MTRGRRPLAAVLVLAAATALAARQAPAPLAQAPTFKLRVDYVEVDTRVTDANGNIVRGLTRDDFQIFDDGKPQSISSFALVDIPVEPFQPSPAARQVIDADAFTNARTFDGRMYVVVIDDLHTFVGRGTRVKSAARQFIEQRLGSNDLMAIVHVGAADGASQDFTNNKRLLLAAVDRTIGRKLDSTTATKTEQFYRPSEMAVTRRPKEEITDSLEAERSDSARRSLVALRDVARWFADVHGRRKSILFFSEGIDYDINDIFNNRNASLLLDTTRETIAAATRGNVSIYAVDPRGLTEAGDETIDVQGFPDTRAIEANDRLLGIGQQTIQKELVLSQSSLRELSEATGGFASVNKNDYAAAFDRVVSDNSSYYVLAYYPPAGGEPGKVHNIDVRVTRPGLTVLARKGYVTPKTVTPVRETSAKNAPDKARKLMTPEVLAALDSPIPVSGLTMHAFAAPFRGASSTAAVVLGVDLRGRDLRLASGDKVTVSYLAVDAGGKIRGAWTNSLGANPTPETKARIDETGLRVVNRVDLAPGRYQIRVAAHDSGGGSVGSVLYDLEVPDFAGAPLTMSGIALGSALGGAMPLAHADDEVRSLLPVIPVGTRAFVQDDELRFFVEIYDNEPATPHEVDITSTVTSAGGQELFKGGEARDSAQLQGKRRAYGYLARIPLRDLAPGSYVLTVSARSLLGDGPSVERRIPFTIEAR